MRLAPSGGQREGPGALGFVNSRLDGVPVILYRWAASANRGTNIDSSHGTTDTTRRQGYQSR
jgi:hypothetical protein